MEQQIAPKQQPQPQQQQPQQSQQQPQQQHQQSQQQLQQQQQTPQQQLQPQQQTSARSASQQDMDLASVGDNGKLSSSPPGSYTRIPPRSIDPSAVPPILPPHLLQVILNNPDKANATILPQPNHVMLNHLYALSIKDGIMVLSATHRFRKKYVTTLLYKPI